MIDSEIGSQKRLGAMRNEDRGGTGREINSNQTPADEDGWSEEKASASVCVCVCVCVQEFLLYLVGYSSLLICLLDQSTKNSHQDPSLSYYYTLRYIACLDSFGEEFFLLLLLHHFLWRWKPIRPTKEKDIVFWGPRLMHARIKTSYLFLSPCARLQMNAYVKSKRRLNWIGRMFSFYSARFFFLSFNVGQEGGGARRKKSEI